MKEENTAVAESADEATSQASSPQAEEPTEVQETTQQTESGETETQELEEDSNVENSNKDVDAQRKAFQEMRQENKRLKDEIEARKKHESAFATFKPQGNQQGPVTLEQFADPETGEVDWGRYNQTIQQQAQVIAEQQVQQKFDEYEARQAHPELFNDPETEEELASQWLFEQYRGNNVSIKEIADRYAKRHSKAVSKAEKKGAEQALTELSDKEKASLEARGQNANQARAQQRIEDTEVMKERVRYGDTESLTALMSQVPWANK